LISLRNRELGSVVGGQGEKNWPESKVERQRDGVIRLCSRPRVGIGHLVVGAIELPANL
jgi:hypothetical protein